MIAFNEADKPESHRGHMNRAKPSAPRSSGGGRTWAGTLSAPVEPIIPGEGQESVWDYPRPPRVEPVAERIRVVVDGIAIADSAEALRVVETAGAPVYYLPPDDVRLDLLSANGQHSICEYKGRAGYYDLTLPGRTVASVAWSYDEPAARVRSDPWLRRVLCRPGRSSLGRRRAGDAPARRVLRRLGDVARGRSDQGWTRHARLVIRRARIANA